MIQALPDKVWSNEKFHAAAKRVETEWLIGELGISGREKLDLGLARKLMQASAILACSFEAEHRRKAFRVATCVYELFGAEKLPLQQALRVVLARLGNFPSIGTRKDVDDAIVDLPLSLAAEELSHADQRAVTINGERNLLTDFQYKLWSDLTHKKRVAVSAPTSAGKSYVLQEYLASVFSNGRPMSAVYLVPTRALIAQVSSDLAQQFAKSKAHAPDIITVPIDADSELPKRAIYVMTQERVQLALAAHQAFAAEFIIVDEAQSISDASRGVLLQWVIDDLLGREPSAQILFASPIIRNLEVFSRLFGLTDMARLTSHEPTVAQNFLPVKIKLATKGSIAVQSAGDGSQARTDVVEIKLGQTTASRKEKLVHIPFALGREQTNIIYANGAAEAEDVAMQLSDLVQDHAPSEAQQALAALALESVHGDYVLANCVLKGVAFHYSNIPTQLRQAIERAVAAGDIKFLVCTSTLLQGVNLPAKNIFMCSPEKGKSKPLESTDFWNLSGRAGRLRREFQGNIFLIDYDNWKKKPLEGPKDSVVAPAIEKGLKEQGHELVRVINGGIGRSSANEGLLETTFVRLYTDLKAGRIQSTLSRAEFDETSQEAQPILEALRGVELKVSVPPEVLRRTPTVSAHKQQLLFDRIFTHVHHGKAAAEKMVPMHPREPDAYTSYAGILKLCHEVIAGIDTSKNLHNFHSLIAIRWMTGWPLPKIIDKQIERQPGKNRRTVIRDTLNLIEEKIRWEAVRLFGCYNVLLAAALDKAGHGELATSIPAMALFLEVGASDKTMISFITLGLSRVTAMKLNEQSARKDLTPAEAKDWLRSRPISGLGLSPLLAAEVTALLATP